MKDNFFILPLLRGFSRINLRRMFSEVVRHIIEFNKVTVSCKGRKKQRHPGVGWEGHGEEGGGSACVRAGAGVVVATFPP